MGTEHVAVLLAAGGSTRLGQPKQLLTRDGEALVRRVARLLLATAPRELVVVLGAHRDDISAALHGIAHRAIVNDQWQQGLASSVRLAATHVRAARVLICVCDQPALDAHHLSALLATPGCAATLHGNRPGVPAIADERLWLRATELSGDRGLGAFFAQRDDCTRFDFPELHADIDTAAHLETARSQGWIDPVA
jgi:molybdenum cofactor cytidylyltransferase